MHTLTTAAHVAHLDSLTGCGLLVLPLPHHDLLDGPVSLHHADWDSMVALLAAHGWEPSEGEDGGLCHESALSDGRQVVGLYGRAPIADDPSLDNMASAFADLRARAELDRTQ